MPAKIAEMVITLNNDGSIFVTGPLENKPLCDALLAGAKSVVEAGAKTTLVSGSRQRTN